MGADFQRTQVGQFIEDPHGIVAGLEQAWIRNEVDAPTLQYTVGRGVLTLRRLWRAEGRGGGRDGRGRGNRGLHRRRRRTRGVAARRLGGRAGGGGRAFLGKDSCELPAQRVRSRHDDGLFGLSGLDHFPDDVHRLQQDLHRVRSDSASAIAHLIEQRFDRVRESGYLHEAERSGAALDGMRCPEDRVDGFLVGGILQGQQPGFHGVEALEAFFEEKIQDLFHFHIDRHGLTAPWRSWRATYRD